MPTTPNSKSSTLTAAAVAALPLGQLVTVLEQPMPPPLKALLGERLAWDVIGRYPQGHSRWRSALAACKASIEFMERAEAA